jgi:hypothetical protein
LKPKEGSEHENKDKNPKGNNKTMMGTTGYKRCHVEGRKTRLRVEGQEVWEYRERWRDLAVTLP